MILCSYFNLMYPNGDNLVWKLMGRKSGFENWGSRGF